MSALDALVEAACVPLDGAHVSGTLERADALLASHPALAGSSIHAAAILGDADAVRRHLAQDPGQAAAKGGSRLWDALTHLCFSRYLRLDPSRSAGFVEAATALLDAGASASTGFTHDGEWGRCTLFDINFVPRPMSARELREGFHDLVRRLYSADFTSWRREKARRMRRSAPRSRTP